MELIDFNARFSRDYLKWCTKNPELSQNEEKMERLFERIREKWLVSPKSWLDGKSPVEYFKAVNDERMLVTMLIEYVNEEVDLPEPLIDELIDREEKVYPILCGILFSDGQEGMEADKLAQVQAICVALISQMGELHPKERYVTLLTAQNEENALTEELCDILAEELEGLREKLLAAYAKARSPQIQMAILDLLCGYENDTQIADLITAKFLDAGDDVALYAACLGRIGDERAIPLLQEALQRPSLDYYRYTAVKYALEELTGEETTDTRSFEEDADYASLIRHEEEENG